MPTDVWEVRTGSDIWEVRSDIQEGRSEEVRIIDARSAKWTFRAIIFKKCALLCKKCAVIFKKCAMLFKKCTVIFKKCAVIFRKSTVNLQDHGKRKVFSCNIRYRICKKRKSWNEKNETKKSLENNKKVFFRWITKLHF